MKALTLIRPWGWAMIHGAKRIENRDWKPEKALQFGERVAIHSGKKIDLDAALMIRAHHNLVKEPPGFWDEGVIGSMLFRELLKKGEPGAEARARELGQTDFFFGRYGLVLIDPRPITPRPCRGMIGLWDLPPDIESAFTWPTPWEAA